MGGGGWGGEERGGRGGDIRQKLTAKSDFSI